MNAVNGLVRRHWRLLAFIVGLFFVFWFLWTLRAVFLPFIIGFILAFLILPVIRWVEKRLPGAGKKPKLKQFKRISILVVIFLLVIVVIGLIVFYAVTFIGQALFTMAIDIPNIIPYGVAAITNWLKSLKILSAPMVQQQLDIYSVRAGVALGKALGDFLTRGVSLIQSSSSMVLGFISMPVFVFFILKDWDTLRDRLQKSLPGWSLTHAKNIFTLLQNVTGRYIRGQLILGLAVGLCVFALLMILKIGFALPLAAFAAVMELVPLIGPWIGAIAGILVTLAIAPDKFIWVTLGYVLIQLLENNLLVPRVQSSQMNINPAFVIILSIFGGYFAGILGFVIILPLTMSIVEIFKYLRKSYRDGEIH